MTSSAFAPSDHRGTRHDPCHTGHVRRVGRGVLVVGAAALGGISASVLTAYVFVFTGHAGVFLQSCASSASTTASGVAHSTDRSAPRSVSGYGRYR